MGEQKKSSKQQRSEKAFLFPLMSFTTTLKMFSEDLEETMKEGGFGPVCEAARSPPGGRPRC